MYKIEKQLITYINYLNTKPATFYKIDDLITLYIPSLMYIIQ